MPQYYKSGECARIDSEYHFMLEFAENGRCFKDEKAYRLNWDMPCYVPENGEVSDKPGFDVVGSYYTHRQLLDLCFGNRKMCDALFSAVDWQEPLTWIENLESEDIYCFYKYVKSGRRVHWNDPTGLNSGEYVVLAGPLDLESDEDCVSYNFDDIVHIITTTGDKAFAVSLCELVKPEWALVHA